MLIMPNVVYIGIWGAVILNYQFSQPAHFSDRTTVCSSPISIRRILIRMIMEMLVIIAV